LFRYRAPDAFSWGAILTYNPLSTDARFGGRLNADFQETFEFRTPVENLYSVIRRLKALVPSGDGVLIANDLLELAFVSEIDCGRAVIQILHGDTDYYYHLAARHEDVIDAF